MSVTEEIEFFVKARDAHQMLADAYNELLERKNPYKESPKDATRFADLSWEHKEGKRGPYLQTSAKANNNSDLWKELKAWLSKNQGKAKLGHDFFWQFENDPNIIGKKTLTK